MKRLRLGEQPENRRGLAEPADNLKPAQSRRETSLSGGVGIGRKGARVRG